MPESIENVTIKAKANVYFDGKIVSHSVVTADGSDVSLGVIFPGEYHLGTAAAEIMDITAGSCVVVIDGTTEKIEVAAGSAFNVGADSGFTITVTDSPCEYVCSYLKS